MKNQTPTPFIDDAQAAQADIRLRMKNEQPAVVNDPLEPELEAALERVKGSVCFNIHHPLDADSNKPGSIFHDISLLLGLVSNLRAEVRILKASKLSNRGELLYQGMRPIEQPRGCEHTVVKNRQCQSCAVFVDQPDNPRSV